MPHALSAPGPPRSRSRLPATRTGVGPVGVRLATPVGATLSSGRVRSRHAACVAHLAGRGNRLSLAPLSRPAVCCIGGRGWLPTDRRCGGGAGHAAACGPVGPASACRLPEAGGPRRLPLPAPAVVPLAFPFRPQKGTAGLAGCRVRHKPLYRLGTVATADRSALSSCAGRSPVGTVATDGQVSVA